MKSEMVTTSRGLRHSIISGKGPRHLHVFHGNGFCAGVMAAMDGYMDDSWSRRYWDFPGHGASLPIEVDGWSSFGQLADEIIAMILATASTPVFALGHSMGGASLLIAAWRRPDLFEKIVIVDPVIFSRRLLALIFIFRLFGISGRIPLVRKALGRRSAFASRDEASRHFKRRPGIFKSWNDDAIDRYVSCAIREESGGTVQLCCLPATEAAYFGSYPGPVWQAVKKCSVPVLALRGETTDIIVPHVWERMKRIMKRAECTEMKGLSHFIPMENSQALLELAENFFKVSGDVSG